MLDMEAEHGMSFRKIPPVEPIDVSDNAIPYWIGRYKHVTETLSINRFLVEDIYKQRPTLRTLQGVIKHELGHYITSLRYEELGIKPLLFDYNDTPAIQALAEVSLEWVGLGTKDPKARAVKERYIPELTEFCALRAITEGIGTYFEGTKTLYRDEFWPDSIMDIETSETFMLYDGGLSIVGPVIERFGMKGLDYLLLNPPRVESLREMPLYRERALQELAQAENTATK